MFNQKGPTQVAAVWGCQTLPCLVLRHRDNYKASSLGGQSSPWENGRHIDRHSQGMPTVVETM